MPTMAVEPDEEAAALPAPEATYDPIGPRARRSRVNHLDAQDEPSAAVRAAERRAARRVFRLYCFSCGRSTESGAAPQQPGRCLTCGGTMLLELAAE
ncbi:MAG: hypothetical protein ACR2IK_20105 [Chloroflexota bacterium]